MANPANSVLQNLLPVQAYFSVDGTFQTFIGQGQPFYATVNPDQSGLNITNSTINSTTIGATTPSTGVFTNITTTTGTIFTSPTASTDIANKAYVDATSQGLSFKQPANFTTTGDITLSGLAVQANGDWTATLTAGNRILVKNQTAGADNGIYLASATGWTRSLDANTWDELVAAYLFIISGTVWSGSSWVDTNQTGGTLGTTPVTFVQFSNNAIYTAGTGLTLAGFQFSITPVGTAGTYGSASQVPVFVTNASGQVTSVTNTSIAIAGSQITSGTIDTARISGSYTGITGVGTLTAGTWNGSTIGVAYGGTGSTTYTTGYLRASGTTAFSTVSTIPSTDITGLGTMSTQNANAVAITGGTISGLSSPLAVPSGGTGASTLTGYVKGSGTSALTASATIPSTDVTGFGTMANQNANAVAITGGSINGTTIGATTASTGAFTSVTGTLDATFNGITVGKGASSISNNTVVGLAALDHITTGQQNTAMGSNALTVATTANNQTAFGYLALRASNGADNTAVGSTALQNTSSGSGNVAMGFQALTANTTGASNTALGRHALITNSTGSNITALGNHAGAYETGSNALYIDAYDRTNTAGDKAGALLYGTFNATPSSQTLTINGQVTLPYKLSLNAALALTGSTGTSGQVLTSAGAGTPTWSDPTSYATVTDDTTTNATRYPLYANATSGNLTTEYVSSTKYQFNPSTGVLTATSFSGAGTGLTGTASSLSIGGNAATATSATSATTATNLAGGTANQIPYQSGVGTTAFVVAPTTASTALTWSGSAFTWATAGTAVTISDDTTTNATRYPLFANATSGTVSTEYVSSTKYKYNPSTGELTAPEVIASNGILINGTTVSASYTIASGNNGFSVGPITVASGQAVTVSSGQRWLVL
jgi:hypothetical protein